MDPKPCVQVVVRDDTSKQVFADAKVILTEVAEAKDGEQLVFQTVTLSDGSVVTVILVRGDGTVATFQKNVLTAAHQAEVLDGDDVHDGYPHTDIE